jgi:hypothetical protein
VETVLVVIFFALFSAVLAFIIRPRYRRRSRRPVALSAATDSPDSPFTGVAANPPNPATNSRRLPSLRGSSISVENWRGAPRLWFLREGARAQCERGRST